MPAAPAKPSGRRVGAIDNCHVKFGFIQHDDFPGNVFFYVTALAPGLTMAHLAKGTLVDFSTTVRASDGQVMATNVALHNAVAAAPKERPPRYYEPGAAVAAAKPLHQQRAAAGTRLTGAITNASASHGFIRHEHYPSNVFFHKDGLAVGLLMSDLPEGSMVAFTVGANPKNGEPMAVDIGLPAGVAYASRAHRDRVIGASAPPPSPPPVVRYHPPSPPKAPLYVHEPGHAGGARAGGGAGFAAANQRHSPPRASHAAGAHGDASTGAHQHHQHAHAPPPQKQHQQHQQPPPQPLRAQPPRSRSHSPPSAHRVGGPSRVGDAWVIGAEVEADESRVLEFKSVDAKYGDSHAWMRDHLLPKLINGFLNRRPLARESATGLVLFGVTDAGRVKGMRADRALRDVLIRDVDTLVRNQTAMNGSAGALTGADVALEFSPVVRRDARTGAVHEMPDLWVGELTIRSCFARCPLYSFKEAGNEVSYERWSGSMRKLTLAEVGSRVVAHADAQSGSAAAGASSSSYCNGRR